MLFCRQLRRPEPQGTPVGEKHWQQWIVRKSRCLPCPLDRPLFVPCCLDRSLLLFLVQILDEFGLPRFFESDSIHVTALIVSEYNDDYSHWNSTSSLSEWLTASGIPAICNVDTRALTKHIRDKGAMSARLEFPGQPLVISRRGICSGV